MPPSRAHGTEKLFKTSGLNKEKGRKKMNQRKPLVMEKKKRGLRRRGCYSGIRLSKDKEIEQQNNRHNSKNKQT